MQQTDSELINEAANKPGTLMKDMKDKRILVVGLGKTGLSCARFLSHQGIEAAVTDSRDQPPGLDVLQTELPDVAVFTGEFSQQVFERADCLIVSPGVSVKHPLIKEATERGAEIIGDIELFARYAKAPVMAITGSNGKSTVTTLLGDMVRAAGMKVAVGGNLGTPALELLEQPVPDFYVLELSSFQLETTYTLNAAVAALLNISEDHMDRYDSIEDYLQAKKRIFEGDGVVVLNADDQYLQQLDKIVPPSRKVTQFTLSQPKQDAFGVCMHENENYLCFGEQALLPVSQLRIQGSHNVANALAALAMGHAAGLPMQAMLEALCVFPGLPHRTEWVANINGVDWFNDSKATNVGAAIAAINGIDANNLVLIAGGQGKGQDFAPLKEAVGNKVSMVILLGEDAQLIETALADAVATVHVSSMKEAVEKAHELAKPGDVVLLSPACASFDMFSGYEERGAVFTHYVNEVQAA